LHLDILLFHGYVSFMQRERFRPSDAESFVESVDDPPLTQAQEEGDDLVVWYTYLASTDDSTYGVRSVESALSFLAGAPPSLHLWVDFPLAGKLPSLHIFDDCDWENSIRSFPLSSEEAEIRTFTFPSDSGHEGFVLVVDPRFAIAHPIEFAEAKQEADKRAGREIVFLAGDLARGLGMDAERTKKSHKIWQALRDAIIRRSGSPELPDHFRDADSLLRKAADVAKIGPPTAAVMMVRKACEKLVRGEFRKDPAESFADALYNNRQEIEKRYGKPRWSELMEIKNVGNAAAHGPDKIAKDDANLLVNSGRSVYNHFFIYWKRHQQRPALG